MSDSPNVPPASAGEEGGGEYATPAKDTAAAVAIAALGVVAMGLALRLPNPGSFFSAPGLLPFLVGLSLVLMAAGLAATAFGAARADAARPAVGRAAAAYFAGDENRRTLLLIAIIIGYVVVLGLVALDLRIQVGPVVLRVSGYEVVSVPVLAVILALFWRAPAWRCILAAVIAVEALAGVFRYGFRILLPGTG